jgi:mannan endo-1,4-beta-mannosidase
VRWTGKVRPRFSEEYTFFTAADDGTRLWVDGKQLINDWTIHAVSEQSGKIRLEAGRLYDIRVEFFEKNGESNASCKLYWESASQKREFIPQRALFYPE